MWPSLLQKSLSFGYRVLYGEIEVLGYDWARAQDRSRNFGEPKPARLAVQKFVKVSLHAVSYLIVALLKQILELLDP